MVVLAKKPIHCWKKRQLLEEALHSGKALEKFRQMIWIRRNLYGDRWPEQDFDMKYEIEVPAKTSGVVTKLVANELRDRGDDVRGRS